MTTVRYRLPDAAHWPAQHVDRIHCGDARQVLTGLPDECVALAVTSPPYWDVVDYGVAGQIGPGSYARYLDDLTAVWRETARVLIPNGKLAVVAPIMPLPKRRLSGQHTRHLKNLAFDIEARILRAVPGLARYSLFVWQKQTTTAMFGSYPYPPNVYEDNSVEFVNVYVKAGGAAEAAGGGKGAEPPDAGGSGAIWRNRCGLSIPRRPSAPAAIRRRFRPSFRCGSSGCIRSARRRTRALPGTSCWICSAAAAQR